MTDAQKFAGHLFWPAVVIARIATVAVIVVVLLGRWLDLLFAQAKHDAVFFLMNHFKPAAINCVVVEILVRCVREHIMRAKALPD